MQSIHMAMQITLTLHHMDIGNYPVDPLFYLTESRYAQEWF